MNNSLSSMVQASRYRERIDQLEQELDLMTAELIDLQDQLLAFYNLSQSTRTNLGIVETLRTLATEAARLLKARGAVVLLLPTLIHYPQPLIDNTALLEIFHQVQADNRILVLHAADQEHLPEGVENLCIVPIQVRGVVNAGLVLIDRQASFSAPDLKLAQAIAEQSGSHIEMVLLYQEQLAQARLYTEMDLARTVQMGLLSRSLPQIPCLDLFAQARPALQVGGDFYDFVSTTRHGLMLTIGDVAGKGMAAAIVMAMILPLMRSAMRFMPHPTPAAILRRVNQDLYDDFTTLGTITTVFAGRYDKENRILQYANAGHAPVIFRPAGGVAQLLEADGAPIGVLPTCWCENTRLPFGPGDLLVVATDGLNEATRLDGEIFGYDRLLQLVDQVADLSAQQIGLALFETVNEFAVGEKQLDDQTLVVLKGQ